MTPGLIENLMSLPCDRGGVLIGATVIVFSPRSQLSRLNANPASSILQGSTLAAGPSRRKCPTARIGPLGASVL
ncbi:hypothetical protein AnigIFM60653_009816 [Aspergillus niger]|nr:hypothetical protein AnigIFM56816_005957 [Aspergillus niger]GLA08286.1 hypothetical protein AnigIFM60653_009816 [Aspergillus niger]